MLSADDLAVRGELTRAIAELGFAPPLGELAARLGVGELAVRDSLRRLHRAHALLLHSGSDEPWVVHPFALTAGSCWVQTRRHGYWANCLYCAFGIAAALDCDAVITTRLGGESKQVRYEVVFGELSVTSDVFHLSTPACQWWDNVIAACASFQPFSQLAEIDRWCARHAMPRGADMTISELWSFAREWYGDYLRKPWRKRSAADAQAVFARHGLRSQFWRLEDSYS
jgi:hypothetical protein